MADWHFCRLAATPGKRRCTEQCQVCVEDQARMRMVALGVAPQPRGLLARLRRLVK
jgi:hypothetical protein